MQHTTFTFLVGFFFRVGPSSSIFSSTSLFISIVRQPFYISICISKLPKQQTMSISIFIAGFNEICAPFLGKTHDKV